MGQKLKEIEFSKLRIAYTTIKEFLEKESGEKVLTLKTKIEEDLSMLGDDSYELMVRFVEKFELEHQDFLFDKHFHSEGELVQPGIIIMNLLTLSIWLPLKTIELLTLNKLKIDKPKFQRPDREVEDMTFKDLLTWYIEGKYATKKDIKYLIAK